MPDIENAGHLIEDKLVTWVREIIKLLPNLVLAAMIVVVGWLLARLVRKVTKHLMDKATYSRTLRRLVADGTYLMVVMVSVFGALSVLHLDKTVTSMLAGAGIIGLALGFAFQDIAANFLSGVIMAVQRPIRAGELVETGDHIGVVEQIDLRTTELRNLQGIQVIIPNKEIFQKPLLNYARNGIRRVDISMGISYGDDLGNVERVTIEAVQNIGDLMPDHEVELFYKEFAESSIRFEVRFWIRATSNKHYQDMKSRAIKAIKAAYDKEKIMLPFPVRTLDFDAKDGEKLDAILGGKGSEEILAVTTRRSIENGSGSCATLWPDYLHSIMMIQTQAAILERHSDGNLEIHFKKDVKLTVPRINEILDARMELGGLGAYSVLVILPEDIDFDPILLTNDHYKDRELHKCTYAVAWETGSVMNQKVVEIFYRYFPQPFPVRMFPTKEAAKAWLGTIHPTTIRKRAD